jgi:hypothetical protein
MKNTKSYPTFEFTVEENIIKEGRVGQAFVT